MNVGSLFSGIGGIEIGFEKAGFQTKWFIESEEFCQKILKSRFPNAKIYGDVTEVDFRTVPKVDILTGGFPCQDISRANTSAQGITGNRSSLWKYYHKAIRILRPKVAFIENVSAITDRGLNVVLADLAEIWYDAEWHCISASSVGALHKRERMFIIAYPNSIGSNNRTYNDGQDGVQENQDRGLEKDKQQRGQWKRWFGKDYKNRYRKIPETYLYRDDDGISRDVDRFRALGNAVVPQVAEVFAEAIKKGEY
jgi:DNA (cytosine-5)-methyltransferase 1